MKTQNLQQKKWCVIDSDSKGNYAPNDKIKFLTKSIQSSLCDYSDAYVLVTGNITVTGGNANAKVAFKNCAPFIECRTEINETFVDKTKNINIAMPMYNLVEYSDNYSDTSGSLWQFKRDKLNVNDINTALTNDNTPSFRCKASIIGNISANGRKQGVKIVAPLNT